MALSVSLGLKQSQRLAMTQSLRQSIEMLQLSTVELAETIASELETNPVLEELSDLEPEESLTDDIPSIADDIEKQLSGDESRHESIENDLINFADASDVGLSGEYDEDKKQRIIEDVFARDESLSDHLSAQIRLLDEPEEMLETLQVVVSLLDENGFFCDDFASTRSRFGIGERELLRALSIISRLDPAGCGAASVCESLLLQARILYPADTDLQLLIDGYFDDISSLFYERAAKKMGVPLEYVVQKVALIQTLDPYPGRKYSRNSIRYVNPEIEVVLADDEVLLTYLDSGLPRLQISQYYREIAKERTTDKKTKEYLRERLSSARMLMKNIAGRRETLMKVSMAIMQCQRSFLKRGPGNLRPLVYAEIAQMTGFHESTISRTATNKYVRTKWGVFELKYFFVSKLQSENGEQSSDYVLKLIQDIVNGEESVSPLTDEEIVARLQKAGIHTARRTVAKYRGILNIPPSNKRKRINNYKMEN